MRKMLIITVAVLLFATGCSNHVVKVKDKKVVSHSSKLSKVILDAPPVPQNAEELVNHGPGPLSGDPVHSDRLVAKFNKKIKEFKPLSKNTSNKDLDHVFNYIYSLVAEDFPSPDSIIKDWKLHSFGDPDLPDERYHFKENTNIEIILDASGSMGEKISGKSKMELAKEAINEFLAQAPKEAKVSLRVYGHKGTGSDADKKVSCSSSELIYNLKPYNQTEFSHSLNQFNPSGWTPMADSLEKAKNDLASFDKKTNTNLVYLVSDGIETCNGNPVKAAKDLANSNIAPIVNVIGFDVDQKGQKQMQEVANAANGIYTTVNNQQQLQEEFDKSKEILQRWEAWKKDAMSTANFRSISRGMDIVGYMSSWVFRGLNQGNNFRAFFESLFKEGRINGEQSQYLQDKESKLEQLIIDSQTQLETDLRNVNDKTLEKTEKSIEEKYNKNTQ